MRLAREEPAMKNVLIMVLPCFMYACGSPVVDYRHRNALRDAQATGIIYVDSLSSLPSCNKDQENQLVYIKDLDLFRVCNGFTWTAADASNAGVQNPEANEVLTLKKFVASPVDLCSADPEIACHLSGGDAARYTDGSLKYRAITTRKISKMDPIAQENRESTEYGSASLHHLSNWDTSELIIFRAITRNAVTADVILQYNANTQIFSIFFDNDQDQHVSADDELLFHPTLLDL